MNNSVSQGGSAATWQRVFLDAYPRMAQVYREFLNNGRHACGPGRFGQKRFLGGSY